MGLAITRELATLMGGTVGVASRPGEGSTFVVRLRLPVATQAARPPAMAPELAGVRALIVDDNGINRQVLRERHQQGGAHRLHEIGAEAGSADLLVNAVAVHLMDCETPEMDGYAATAELRRREAGGRRLPVVAMTAHAMEGDRERCLAAGMDDYVTKPVDPGAIVMRRFAPTAASGREPTGSASAHAGVLDAHRLAELGAMLGPGHGDRMRTIAQTFARDTSARLQGIRQAADRADAGALRQLAHALKGSCLNLGAARMADIASALERAAAEPNITAAPPLIDELETEFERTASALDTACAGGSSMR